MFLFVLNDKEYLNLEDKTKILQEKTCINIENTEDAHILKKKVIYLGICI